MRKRNWRLVLAGVFLLILSVGFFIFMLTIAHRSDNPAEVMKAVGQVSGATCGVSLVMIVAGLIGRKA